MCIRIQGIAKRPPSKYKFHPAPKREHQLLSSWTLILAKFLNQESKSPLGRRTFARQERFLYVVGFPIQAAELNLLNLSFPACFLILLLIVSHTSLQKTTELQINLCKSNVFYSKGKTPIQINDTTLPFINIRTQSILIKMTSDRAKKKRCYSKVTSLIF